jgi:hypothetical protein
VNGKHIVPGIIPFPRNGLQLEAAVLSQAA